MQTRITALPIAAALMLSAFAPSVALAGSVGRPDAVSVPAVIGAAYNSPGRADSVADVRRLGGFATAAAVRWLTKAAEDTSTTQPVFHVPGVIGAMSEGGGVTRSPEEVRREGGFATAGAVLWLAQAPRTKTAAAF